MDWLVQTLRAARVVRDWANPSPAAAPPPTPSSQTDEDDSLTLAPIGPARAKRRAKKPPRARPPKRVPPPSAPRGQASPIPVKLLDRDAVEVVRRLRRFGHNGYIVGGCVRDLLVGREPKDFDVSTSARPEEIKKIFRNSRIIGRRFRLAHIFFRGGKIIETATFRGQAPQDDEESGEQDLLITRDNVWGTEEEDAQRRDFTINGLMYDVPTGTIIDHVGGLDDVRDRVVRTIGDPAIRVQEDPVRILRAARFAAKLDFTIEPQLLEAMQQYKGELARCAQPRVLEETFKLIRSGHAAQSVDVMARSGILDAVIAELHEHVEWEASLESPPPVTVDAYLAALDQIIATRGPVGDAVVFAAALHAPLDREIDGLDPKDASQALASYVAFQADQLGVTRKVRERMRQIFSAQKSFRRSADKRGRRRVSPLSFIKRSYFPESLDLFEIWSIAAGEDLDVVAEWRDRAANAPPSDDDDSDSPGGRRRKPRRRRKGRASASPDA